MSVVLAIEPDRIQADILREVHAGLGVRLTVVTSKDAALEAIDSEIPDLILVNALLSPREEVDLVAHLRSMDDLSHVQLLTIPRLARKTQRAEKKSSLFGFGKKRGGAAAPDGCDPAAFAEQVTTYLVRAQEVKARPRARIQPAVPRVAQPAPILEQTPAAPAYASEPPYEAPPATPAYEPPLNAPLYEAATSPASFDGLPTQDSNVANADPVALEGDIDRLLDRLGFAPAETPAPPVDVDGSLHVPQAAMAAESEVLIDLDGALGAESAPADPLVMFVPPAAQRTAETVVDQEPILAEPIEPAIAEAREAQISETDLARIRAEAEAALAAELERVHAEAAQQRERELARWQAEAEALREATVGRAREEAEAKAREAFAAELERSRAQSEQVRSEELARLQAEADERLEEVTRQARQVAEAEAARAFAEELARVRAQSEAAASRALDDEVARVRAEAEARLQAELERVRREAEEARRAEQAAALAEAERIREAAAREAREIAEAAAARTLEAEVQRVRAEAEAMRAAAEARLAEQTKAQADASQAMAEAERIREAAAREAREIAEKAAAEKLEAELARVRAEADRRLKEHQEAEIRAEKMREAAAREARAIAEATAAQALEAEIRRVKAEADQRLAAELEQLRADAEARRAIELEEIRRQVEQLREAAAEQARTAASEAIAAEVARTAAMRGTSAPPKPVPVVRVPAAKTAAPQIVEPVTAAAGSQTPSSSYYDLWRAEGSPPLSTAEVATAIKSVPSRFREKRWMLPAAAAVLLAVCGSFGLSVDTSAWASTARKALASALPVGGSKPEAPPAADAAPTTGDLLVETTPKGAEVIVDGTKRGKTPLTITGLSPGRHHVVLTSSDGVVIRREVMVRVGERAVASELMVSGWLTVHSRLPVEVHVGGRRIGSSDEQLILAPGRHKVTLINKEYNIRETRTVEVQAGSIASHTFKLPNGLLDVEAPEGAEVLVDGDRLGAAPVRGAAVAVGRREVVVRHASLGERRETVDVRHGTRATINVAGANPGVTGRSFDGLKVLSESAANPGVRKPARPRP